MNMLDYLDWRADITFQERQLNEIDNLIFSTLVYLKMETLGLSDEQMPISLYRLLQLCKEMNMDTSDTPCDPVKLLKKAAVTERFRNVKVELYTSMYDSTKQIQFAAAVYTYDNKKSYIAFRGTDNTLTGWREDCNLSYLVQTPGQRAAVDYINHAASRVSGDFIVGGHSKGGNLAVYGAAFCNEDIRKSRISKIFSNDGPGFNSEIAESENYISILDKVEKIIPESSYVGILLSSKARKKIISSSARGKNQHNPYSWKVKGTHFEPCSSRSSSSILLDSTMSTWIDSLKASEKQLIIDSIFDALESSGAETLKDLTIQKKESLISLLKTMVQMDPEERKQLAGSFGKLFSAGKNTVIKPKT